MSQDLVPLALLWHVSILAAVCALIVGWRPARSLALPLLAAPLISAAVAALRYHNPFNAVSLGLLSLTFLLLGARAAVSADTRWSDMPSRDVLISGRRAVLLPAWTATLGVPLLAYGCFYPAFDASMPWYRLAYAAPVGVVPCPTLAVVAAFVLLARGWQTRAVPAVLAVWSAFYALFGIFLLGVRSDAGLFVAAIGLSILALQNARRPRHEVSRTGRGSLGSV